MIFGSLCEINLDLVSEKKKTIQMNGNNSSLTKPWFFSLACAINEWK